MSKWKEIRNDYTDGIETTVEAWMTTDDDEEGKVIAVIINDTREVEYNDLDAKTDEYAQEAIKDVLNRLEREDKKKVCDLISNYIYNCNQYGYSDFEVWCKDNIGNIIQKELVDAIKVEVNHIADKLFE